MKPALYLAKVKLFLSLILASLGLAYYVPKNSFAV